MRLEEISSAVFIAPQALNQVSVSLSASFPAQHFQQWYIQLPAVTQLWQQLDPQGMVPASMRLQAFCHSSFVHEFPSIQEQSYERLEFVGDAALGLVVAHALYSELPQAKEGELSQMRRALVSGDCCRMMSEVLELQQLVLTGKGEWRSIEKQGSWQHGPKADLVENVIGAIYLSAGLELASHAWKSMWSIVSKSKKVELLDYAKGHFLDAKSALQQLTMQQYKTFPHYEFNANENGFTVDVQVEGRSLASATAATKKAAQHLAAHEAIKKIEQGYLN